MLALPYKIRINNSQKVIARGLLVEVKKLNHALCVAITCDAPVRICVRQFRYAFRSLCSNKYRPDEMETN